jgi:hypothetical protein
MAVVEPVEVSSMRITIVAIFAAVGASMVPSAARADLAPPIPAPKEVKFVIEVDESAKAPRLIVPQNLTTVRIRPAPNPKGGAVPPKVAPPIKDGEESLTYLEFESTVEPATDNGRNPNHLMIAGVALTLAFGMGGVWLVRRNGRSATRGLALLVAAGATLAASTIVWANVPAPKLPSQPRKEIVLLPVAFDGKANLEVTFGGDTIRLILDKETYAKIKEKPKAPAAK